MLSKAGLQIEPWLMRNSTHLPFGEPEASLILAQLGKGMGIVQTTSCGRVLDAVAAVLGVCYERSYEGEPAMKLESAALKGKDVLNLKPAMHGDFLNTTDMLVSIFEKKEELRVADLAYSAHAYLANGLASLAVEKALLLGVKVVGFSGGTAYNQIFTHVMRKTVEDAGLRFLVHEAVPAGDGGVSFGQAVVGGFSRF
jgi:hydrogenase maturation protein HypF